MVKRNINHVIDKEYGTKENSSRRDEAPLQCYLRMEDPITITPRARLSCFLHSRRTIRLDTNGAAALFWFSSASAVYSGVLRTPQPPSLTLTKV
ncbi:hypothetical protein E2C01_017737 [Portunus trituberculatus]|uniref:Uncharacterized protein n=1 Tax=Portunus trituberculatus TaxID=210409 RepID=A0A5B7DUC7_PORTR|nr:hypothetical protein [Portunus trituberculatus]